MLIDDNREVNVGWILSHQGVEDNKQADQTAKKAAARSTATSNEKVSLAHVRRAQTEVREAHRQDWLSNALRNKASECRCRYRAQNDWRQDSAIAAALRRLACCYVQLKSGHAAIGAHLTRIKA